MAWTTIGTTNVVQTSAVLGYVYLQYDDASSGTTWAVRLITGPRSGYSFSVQFNNVTVDGNNQGTKNPVTQNSVVVWSGSLSGGRSISGSWSCSWSSGARSYTISGTLPTKPSAPTGGSVTFNSSTWNTIDATTGVANWGSSSAGNIHLMVVTGTTNGDADNYTSYNGHARREFFQDNTGFISYRFSATDSSTNATYDGTPLSIKGLLHYKLGYYNYTSVGAVNGLDNTLRYLPPAPAQITYTDPGGLGTKNYVVTFTGVVANNHTTYDTADLNRTVRYKIDNGSWVVYESSVVKTIDATTVMTIPVPAGSTATVEGWMSYKNLDSDPVSVVITNTNEPVHFYGGVSERDPVTGEWSDPEAKEVVKFYGSLNDETVKIIKIYGSHEGVARKVFEDE